VGRRSKYPEEFRQRAAQLVLDSRRSIRDVAAELGVNHETLRNWVAAERRKREILKKAAVFFARETGR
jgi:transposase